MPIVDIETPGPFTLIDTPQGFAVTPGQDDIDHGSEKPDFLTGAAAVMRQGNPLTSWAYSETRNMPVDQEPGFNPWDAIKGTKYEANWQSFVEVRNTRASDAMKRQIDNEIADKRLVSAMPLYQSFPVGLAAGVIDPSIALPGGAFVRGVKGGFSIAKTAASTAGGAALQTAVQEAGLHSSQETREISESAINIGASVVLSGLLGAAGAKLLTPAEWKAAVTAIEREIAEPVSGVAAPQSAGAAAHEPAPLDANTIAGRAAGAVAASTSRLNPALRILESPSAATREIGTQLFENSIYLKKNLEGVASEPAVETLMKEWNGGLAKAVNATESSYPEYVKGGGTLSRTEFREAVGRAMRRGDDDANPFVAKIAQTWRRDVFDPLKEAAIKVGLLPEDVSVETAASYFSRMWNINKLNAREGEFKSIVSGYYQNAIQKEYEKAGKHFIGRKARLDQEMADLELSAEDRVKTLEQLETASREHEAQWPSLSEAADRLSEIRSEIRAARKAGNEAEAERLRQESASIRAKFTGDSLQAFSEKRTELSIRRRNVDLGSAGLQERSDRILGQLADIEEANQRAMDRLIKKGQKLERDLDRLDADALEQRLSDLAESYSTTARKAEASAERARLQVENINKRAAAQEVKNIEKGAEIAAASDQKIAERLTKEAERQQKLSGRMAEIAQRLETAKGFDHDGLMAEIKGAIEKATRETSAQSMARGERAARLGERMAALSPEKIKQRIATIERMKSEQERKFFDRWEIRNLGQGVEPGSSAKANFSEAAKAIADQAFATLTGRVDTAGRPEFLKITSRGPMKDRTLNIPDKLVEDFLEHDVDLVGRRYARVMGADVEIARKFGSVNMLDQLQRVRDDYARLRAGVTDEKQLRKIGEQERSDIRDLEALRDLLRGTRHESPIERNYASIVRSANHVNYIRSMGEVVLASLTDAIRPAMVHGLGQFMATVPQLATNMKAIKLSVGEAQLGGNVTERVLGHRLATISEITDPYASRGPIEAFLENMTNVASKWNGIRIWTDMMKSVASVMTQNRILAGASDFIKIKPKERAYLAYLGIDESMAGRIAAQFKAHGETIDKVRVANTQAWTDPVAVRTYRAAMNKDVDSIIVQKSVADVPLFAHTPTGKALLQFKSFALASHQKVLLRGLQEDQSRFVGGVIAMTAMGMAITYLKAVSGNRPEARERMLSNPGWWIGEGLDRSGVLSVPMEIANTFEKFSGGFNPIKAPMRAFDAGGGISQKNQNRSDIGSLLGPTIGMGGDIMTAGTIPKRLIEGEDVTQGQKNAAERLIPFNSYSGIRQMLRYLANPPD